MPQFHFQGINKEGRKVIGTMDAANEGDLRVLLRDQGIRPTRISKRHRFKVWSRTLRKPRRSINEEALIWFTRQLYSLIVCKISMARSLDLVIDSITDSEFKAVLHKVQSRTTQGNSTWEAMAAYPQIFSKLYVSVIRLGETSQALDISLKRLLLYLEEEEDIHRTLRGLLSPVLILVLGLSSNFLICYFTSLVLEAESQRLGEVPPPVISFLLSVFHLISDNLGVVIGLALVLVYTWIRFYQSFEGRTIVNRILLRIPKVKSILKMREILEFTRAIKVMLESGSNLIDAVDTQKVSGRYWALERSIRRVRTDIEAGRPLGLAMNKVGIFPRAMVQIIMMNELNGNVLQGLENVCNYHSAELNFRLKRLSSILKIMAGSVVGLSFAMMFIAMCLSVLKMIRSSL